MMWPLSLKSAPSVQRVEDDKQKDPKIAHEGSVTFYSRPYKAITTTFVSVKTFTFLRLKQILGTKQSSQKSHLQRNKN